MDQQGEHSALEVFVSQEESGQKLLQFLARRFDTPQSVLHRWVRTGQVRRNGKRTQPFARLNTGDAVRLPPFAFQDTREEELFHEETGLPAPDILLQTRSLFVCVKPAGLPTHAGTGHMDSLVARLREHCAEGSRFAPTPAHRLDKSTSGLVLVARSYEALRLLHDAMVSRDALVKTYLAWAAGRCPWYQPTLLEDGIVKTAMPDGRERMELVPLDQAGKKASLTAECLDERFGASLLRIILHTGRTHQIRAQLSGRGVPLVGDVKYGGPACDQGLMLHASNLTFSKRLACQLGLPDTGLYCPPPWLEPWDIWEQARS